MNAHVPSPRRPLRPQHVEIVKVLRDALRQTREDEIGRMQDIINVLKNLHAELVKFRRDLPAMWREAELEAAKRFPLRS
jgi:hypothetical protein